MRPYPKCCIFHKTPVCGNLVLYTRGLSALFYNDSVMLLGIITFVLLCSHKREIEMLKLMIQVLQFSWTGIEWFLN